MRSAFPELPAPAAEELGRSLSAAAAPGAGRIVSVDREPLESTWYRTESIVVDFAVPLYRERVERLMEHRRTLVHGAFRPAQILVNAGTEPVRICPTDWEISAMGSCLYDLAALTDGFQDRELVPFLEHFLEAATWLHEDQPRPRRPQGDRNVQHA